MKSHPLGSQRCGCKDVVGAGGLEAVPPVHLVQLLGRQVRELGERLALDELEVEAHDIAVVLRVQEGKRGKARGGAACTFVAFEVQVFLLGGPETPKERQAERGKQKGLHSTNSR